jgi:hypothetical protein
LLSPFPPELQQAGVFTDECSDQAVDALLAMEPHILNSAYCLIELKPILSVLDVLHDIEVIVNEIHGHSTNFAKTVRDRNLPVGCRPLFVSLDDKPMTLRQIDFRRRWQSIEAAIGAVLEQAQVCFSLE